MNFEDFAKGCPKRKTMPISDDACILAFKSWSTIPAHDDLPCCEEYECVTFHAIEYLEIRILKGEIGDQHKGDEHPYRCLLCSKEPNLYEVHESKQVMISCSTKNCPSVSVAGNSKEEVVKSWNNVQLGLI